MQLYALDKEQKIIYAGHAAKQQDYYCLECQQSVRVRGGLHRQIHFYHLSADRPCRQNKKTMEHIQAQLYLFSLFPPGEAELENRFPKINRIADLVWKPQSLVFEIQCSPITAIEVQERNRDYLSEGFQVIWILHDKRFNQRRLTAAEQFLRQSPYYFTNIDTEGQGIIYDQFDIYENGFRKLILPQLPIEPNRPIITKKLFINENHSKEKTNQIPHLIKKRLELWPINFAGDLIYLYLSQEKSDYFEKAFEAESKMTIQKEKTIGWQAWIKKLLFYCFIKPYRLFFQILLERACK